ncbi:YxiG-like protein [Streptomyces toxytricini]|uniref:YxiG-like protein n=1 Tax=Streptomyces toxytricini TaxID=67369 RepID=UPI003F4DB038
MDTAELQRTLNEHIEAHVVHHGDTTYTRDYEVIINVWNGPESPSASRDRPIPEPPRHGARLLAWFARPSSRPAPPQGSSAHLARSSGDRWTLRCYDPLGALWDTRRP